MVSLTHPAFWGILLAVRRIVGLFPLVKECASDSWASTGQVAQIRCGRGLHLTPPIFFGVQLNRSQPASAMVTCHLLNASIISVFCNNNSRNILAIYDCAQLKEGQNNNRPVYCCPLFFFVNVLHSLPFALSVYLLGFVCWKLLEKKMSFVYRAHGISVILGIFQHSLILIGLAAVVSQSKARQWLVMASGGNMSITKRAALC